MHALSKICNYIGKTYKRRLTHCVKYNLFSRKNMSSAANPIVGVVQMTATNNKDENFEFCSSCILKGKEKGANMIFLPEAFDYIAHSKDESVAMAECIDGETISKYQNIAKKCNLWLSLGGFHQKSYIDNQLLNTHIIIDNNGITRCEYSKIHLFDILLQSSIIKESSYTTAGKKIINPIINTPVGSLGLSICYDLRFPQLSQILFDKGATVLTYPSAFTKFTGAAHWEVLLRARAIENQCFVIAAAQVGKHNEKRESYGHSMIIDPWGDVLLDMGPDKVGISTASLDLSKITSTREKMPIFQHRRLDLYQCAAIQDINSINEKNTFMNESMLFGPDIKIPAEHIFLHRQNTIFGFVNVSPIVPGHVLLCPVRIVERLADLTKTEVELLFTTMQEVAKKIVLHYQATSITIGIQDGIDAGQTVPHVHVHVLPRRPGDFENNDAIYQELQNHDKEVNRKKRSFQEMAEEASVIRELF